MTLPDSRCLRAVLLALAVCTAGCASQSTLDSFYSVERTLSGVSEKSLQVGDHNWVYAEKGEGEVVLLLHGFAASKEVWMRMVADMPAGYRYIMPDLPGFGRSTRWQLRRIQPGAPAGGVCGTTRADAFPSAGQFDGRQSGGALCGRLPAAGSDTRSVCPVWRHPT